MSGGRISTKSNARDEFAEYIPTEDEVSTIAAYLKERLRLEDIRITPGPGDDAGGSLHLVGKLFVGSKHHANVVIIIPLQSVRELNAYLAWVKRMNW